MLLTPDEWLFFIMAAGCAIAVLHNHSKRPVERDTQQDEYDDR